MHYLSEYTNTTFHQNLSQEEIISKQPLLKPSEIHQPPKKRRFLQINEPRHDLSSNLSIPDCLRQIQWQAVQRTAEIRQHEQCFVAVLFPSRLIAVVMSIIITSASSALISTSIGFTSVIPTSIWKRREGREAEAERPETERRKTWGKRRSDGDGRGETRRWMMRIGGEMAERRRGGGGGERGRRGGGHGWIWDLGNAIWVERARAPFRRADLCFRLLSLICVLFNCLCFSFSLFFYFQI